MARWFGPKKIGYGVGPRSRQGWIATAVFMAAFIGVHLIPFAALGYPHWWRAASGIAVLAVFLLVVWLKYEPDAHEPNT